MMRACSTQFSDFILDFNLKNYEVGVCFDASVNYNVMGQNICVQSEVFMEAVFAKEIDTIHFLNPIIEQHKMPVFFNEVNHQFLYINNACLLISGTIPVFGPFTISVFPKSNSGKSNSLAELRSKKYN